MVAIISIRAVLILWVSRSFSTLEGPVGRTDAQASWVVPSLQQTLGSQQRLREKKRAAVAVAIHCFAVVVDEGEQRVNSGSSGNTNLLHGGTILCIHA